MESEKVTEAVNQGIQWDVLAYAVSALGLLMVSLMLGRKAKRSSENDTGKWKRLELLTLISAIALAITSYLTGGHFTTEGLSAWVLAQKWVLLAFLGLALADDLTTYIALRQTPGEGEGNPWMAKAFKEHGQLKASMTRWVGILAILAFIILAQVDRGLLLLAVGFGLVVLNNVSAILQFVFRPEFARKVRALQMDRTLYTIRIVPLLIPAVVIAYLI